LDSGGAGPMKITRRNVLLLLLVSCLIVWPALLALEYSYREPDNFALIEENLYMGGSVLAPPPGTRAVLNLCPARDRYQCEVYVHDPIPDAAPGPTMAWLREKVEFIDAQRCAERTTYVHCMNGASRSGLVVAAYLMHKHGWTRDEAVAFIRERRPQMRPNPAFMKLLSEWERMLCAS
jgi:hypothetical protein